MGPRPAQHRGIHAHSVKLAKDLVAGEAIDLRELLPFS